MVRVRALDFRSPVPGWAPSRQGRTLPRVCSLLLWPSISLSFSFHPSASLSLLSRIRSPLLLSLLPCPRSFFLSLSTVCFEIRRPRWCAFPFPLSSPPPPAGPDVTSSSNSWFAKGVSHPWLRCVRESSLRLADKGTAGIKFARISKRESREVLRWAMRYARIGGCKVYAD